MIMTGGGCNWQKKGRTTSSCSLRIRVYWMNNVEARVMCEADPANRDSLVRTNKCVITVADSRQSGLL